MGRGHIRRDGMGGTGRAGAPSSTRPSADHTGRSLDSRIPSMRARIGRSEAIRGSEFADTRGSARARRDAFLIFHHPRPLEQLGHRAVESAKVCIRRRSADDEHKIPPAFESIVAQPNRLPHLALDAIANDGPADAFARHDPDSRLIAGSLGLPGGLENEERQRPRSTVATDATEVSAVTQPLRTRQHRRELSAISCTGGRSASSGREHDAA